MPTEQSGSLPSDQPMTGTDSTVPHSARITNFWLGGKDHYAVDREAGERYMETFPSIVEMARSGREFLARAVGFLAGQGIRQYLDIGTGLPTADNTHELAQRAAPESRIVYVDNDPMVLAHARVLLTSTPEGAADYLDADLRDPAAILAGAAALLDFDRPVALMLMGIIGHVGDDAELRAILAELLAALVPGSYLVIGDGSDLDPAQVRAQERYNEGGSPPYRLRSPEQLESLFDGLELVEPGLVPAAHWRPGPDSTPYAETISRCGIARKP
ncbi:SAM-dependent methyltransferase [Saccharopolyspora taberi]|uniref:SAM-dependent methyltransferase n=1 Tax=Saccharopolyspora taberi TaxID=60895 RepID=A0ABN3V9C8_9PSEU